MNRKSYARRQGKQLVRRAFTSPPPDPRSAEEIREAQDLYALQQAVAWGYRGGEPETLDLAIERLEHAARVGADPYADRSDPWAEQRASDTRSLAAELVDIRGRGAHKGGTTC
jgi:hypothetical protein